MAFTDLEKAWPRLIEYLGRSSGGRWENLIWRSGLCNWCRGCMQMRGAISMLVRDTLKSLKWRSVFAKAQYSALCPSSLCLKPCHESSTLGSPGKIYAGDLVIIAESLKECVRRLLTWKEAMKEKGLRVNAGKTMIWGTGLDLLQSSGEFPCAICCTRVGSNSSIFCIGCKCLTKDPDYRCTWCQGTACPLDGRSQKEVRPDKLEVVASFCYLGDMLSAASQLWTFNHNTCENRLEDIQRAATSSLFPPPLFQDR